MKVPFTISDFLYRAENVYSDRIALVDEPDMPGGGLGELTWREFGVKVRASRKARRVGYRRRRARRHGFTKLRQADDLILGSFGLWTRLCAH